MKHALEAGDYNQAVEAAGRASALKNNWKVKISLFCLRTAPRLFRRLHLVRTFLMRRAKHSNHATAFSNSAESNRAVTLEESTTVEAAVAPAEVSPRGRN